MYCQQKHIQLKKAKTMKNITKKQIASAKLVNELDVYKPIHGNTKKINGLLVEDFKAIAKKKNARAHAQRPAKKSSIAIVRELVAKSLAAKGTPYFKVLIEGNNNIYYASAEYGHADYNKTRVLPITEKNLKLVELFDKIVNK